MGTSCICNDCIVLDCWLIDCECPLTTHCLTDLEELMASNTRESSTSNETTFSTPSSVHPVNRVVEKENGSENYR